MRSEQTRGATGLLTERGDPVVVVPMLVDGKVVYFHGTKSEYESIHPREASAALKLPGAWSDLDWEETLEALDRIRHESEPTPPTDFPEWNDMEP